MSDKKAKTADETKVDDMLIEMITPKVREIEEKFGRGEGLTQDDINTLLLKSQYNHINHLDLHINHLDLKLNEVVADVASLKSEFDNKFNSLKSEFDNKFNSLQSEFDNKFNSLQSEFELLKQTIETTIQKALNRNMLALIVVMGAFLTLSKIIDKL